MRTPSLWAPFRTPFFLIAVAFLVLPGIAMAQPPEQPPEQPPPEQQPLEQEPASPPEVIEEFTETMDASESDLPEADFSAIEDLLREDEAVRSAESTEQGYDPGSRRDPFRSLIQSAGTQREVENTRPEGKGGLLIDEVEIEGVFELPDGPVAQVKAGRGETSYLLSPGDELWDGDVVSITLNEVVFKQSVEDENALKPFRMVTKRLSP